MSLQKTSLPALLMFVGGWIATAGAVVVLVVAAVVAALLLLLPQPAATSTANKSATSPAKPNLGRCIVLPFLCKPGRRRAILPLARLHLPEVRLADLLVLAKALGVVREGHAASLEHVPALRGIERHQSVLLDEQDRRPLLVDL